MLFHLKPTSKHLAASVSKSLIKRAFKQASDSLALAHRERYAAPNNTEKKMRRKTQDTPAHHRVLLQNIIRPIHATAI